MFQCTFCTLYYDEATTCCGHVTPDVRTFVTLFESHSEPGYKHTPEELAALAEWESSLPEMEE